MGYGITPQEYQAYWDLTAKEIADELGVNPVTVRRYFSERKQGVKGDEKHWRTPSVEICLKLQELHEYKLSQQRFQYASRFSGTPY